MFDDVLHGFPSNCGNAHRPARVTPACVFAMAAPVQPWRPDVGGGGPEGTAQFLGSLGIEPSDRWAYAAGAAELGGGALTAVGLMNPIGPIAGAGSMAVAMRTAHKGKPIWVTHGGAELPVTNLAILGAITIAGPGALSLDSLFGIKIPWWLSFFAMIATAAAAAMASTPSITQQRLPRPPMTAKTNA